jgi:hypothetical protein
MTDTSASAPAAVGSTITSPVAQVNADPDLEQRVKKVSEKVSENIHIVANEPSLALFRLQEHVRKSLPVLIERKIDANKLHQELQGKYYDAEYAVQAIKSMYGSCSHFQNIQDLLKNAIFLKQQLTYEESRRQDRRSQGSMYQRLSSLSIDLNELPDALKPLAAVLANSGVSTDRQGAAGSSRASRDASEKTPSSASKQ